jgi:hypothetical protein
MARSNEPDSASSQFYICDGPQHGLDDWERDGNGYAVFGVVIEGLDIAKEIAACDTYGNRRPLLRDHPVDDITMTRVTVEDGVWENETSDDDQKGKESSGNDIPGPGAFGIVLSIAFILILTGRKKA